jgi:hypothetical protein
MPRERCSPTGDAFFLITAKPSSSRLYRTWCKALYPTMYADDEYECRDAVERKHRVFSARRIKSSRMRIHRVVLPEATQKWGVFAIA